MVIEALYREWRSLQPLSAEDRRRLELKFMLEFNYNSNRIEGNTLTYGQTRLLFLFGTTSDGVPLRDYEEMKAHNVGLELVKREAADRERPLTEQFIRQLNRTILVEDFYKTQKDAAGEIRRYEVKVGQYKTRPNSVITATGEVFDYASPEETSALMTDLTAWYNEQEAKGELSPIELATLFHYRYIRIHPFEDGNGRIARLLVNYILLRHDYPMIIVRSDDKKNYLNVLHKCDVEVGLRPSDGASAQIEQVEPFVVYVKTLAERALNIAIRAGKGESIEDIDDFAKRIALLEREAKNKKGRAKFSETEVWDVLEFLYFPVKNRIDEALKPAMSFFSTVDEFSTINKSKYYKFAGVGEHLIYNADRNYSDVEMDDFISNAKYVHLSIYLEHPKREYSLGNLDIKINFVVEFEDSYYTINSLNNKQFSYGTYPSEEEIGQIVSGYKTDVLNKIEKAIQNRK